MTVYVGIADLVTEVSKARRARDTLLAEIAAKRSAFEDSIRFELDLLAEFKTDVEERERLLRAAVVAHYAATGEKRPHPAVQVRQGKDRTVCEYPESEALKYALEHTVALKLDTGILETYLQAMPEPARPSWFHVRTETPEPVATIARDLATPEGPTP